MDFKGLDGEDLEGNEENTIKNGRKGDHLCNGKHFTEFHSLIM